MMASRSKAKTIEHLPEDVSEDNIIHGGTLYDLRTARSPPTEAEAPKQSWTVPCSTYNVHRTAGTLLALQETPSWAEYTMPRRRSELWCLKILQ